MNKVTVLKHNAKLKIPFEAYYDSFEFENPKSIICPTEEFFTEFKMIENLITQIQGRFLSYTLFENYPEISTVFPTLLERVHREVIKIFREVTFSLFLRVFMKYVRSAFQFFQVIVLDYLELRDEYDLASFCLEVAEFWKEQNKRLNEVL